MLMPRLLLALVSMVVLPGAGSGQSIARAVTTQGRQDRAAPKSAGLQSRISLELDAAPFAEALNAIARQAAIKVSVTDEAVQINKRVTLRARGITALEAFQLALQGTRVRMTSAPDGQLFFALIPAGASKAQGNITGRVIDASTKRAVVGATLQIEGMNRGSQTGDDGTYRITDVPPGSHILVVRRIGYGKVSRPVTVGENATLALDVSLEPSANALDQVVVTGTIVQTELKAVPSAITVVTAKQIEERGITKIDQLFRGDVPGLFAQNQGSNALLDEVTMFSRGATALSLTSVGSPTNGVLTNPIKTYIDGIELADAKYLSQIDPKTIERIEIVSGPQASTIYGSNAINGVMQIFTKRGSTSRPQLSLSLLSGWVENNFSSARTPQHDYSAQLSAVEGRLSYSAGGSWNYMGAWTPAKQMARTGGVGGARLDLPTPGGRVSADLSLRRALTQSLQRGAIQQTSTGYREAGWYTNFSNSGLSQPTTYTLVGQTLGLTLSYAPTRWWSHELSVGSDVSDNEQRVTAPGYTSLSDSALFLRQNHADRRSLRYATTARVAVTSFAEATVTAGADAWQNLTSIVYVYPQTLTGSLTGSSYISRQPGHNTGGFLQTQLAIKDRLYLTQGLRAEWNPGFGEEAQPNIAPRYGVAFSQEVGPITAKLRGSYGRSTRPPQSKLKAAQTASEVFGADSPVLTYFGNFDRYIANLDLGPEYQQGGEGGIELYFGTRGSLVVTRYNQTIDKLIDAPRVDSARTLIVCPSSCPANSWDADGYGYRYQYQYLNVGSIRNQGWELQGSMAAGPLTTRGTYSWTKSRTIGVTPRYAASFDPLNYPQYQLGATFKFLPEHTWAFGVTYARGTSSVGLNVTGTGRVTNVQDDFYFESLSNSIRLPHTRLNISAPFNGYVSFNAPYTMADLTASHRFASRIEGVLQVQNLTDRYTNDFSAAFASLGRQTKVGARIRTN